jgi:hypothetical protein
MIEYFNTRNDMFSTFRKNMVIAELGVFEGEFSKEIYSICKPKELYLVDLFSGYFGSGDKDGNNHHYVQLEDEYEKLKINFIDNVEVKILKKSTVDFLNEIQNDMLDIVYIDADHSYSAVKRDLKLTLEKIKYGGLICGHDYVRYTEVELAVNEFCNENNLKIKYLTNDGCPSYCIVKL